MPKLERLELTSSIPIIIPDEVLNKIKYLCMTMHDVEWSGVLFYQVKGTIRNTDKMKIILKDVLLMDRGIKAHTKFDWDEDIVEYRMDNPDSMEWLVGLIHSHNTMTSWFSHEDWDELNENCPLHNFYLSLIVNNYTNMVAKVAFTGEPKEFICKDERGLNYSITLSSEGANVGPVMFVYDCDPQVKKDNIRVPDTFADRVGIVSKKSAKRDAEEERKRAARNQVVKLDNKIDSKSPFPDWDKGINQDWNQGWGKSDHYWMDEPKNKDNESEESKFLAFMFRIGNKIEEDDVISALEDIEFVEINMEMLLGLVAESYDELYIVFFGSDEHPAHYFKILEGCIQVLKSVRKGFPEVDNLIDKLVQKQTDMLVPLQDVAGKQNTQIIKQGDK